MRRWKGTGTGDSRPPDAYPTTDGWLMRRDGYSGRPRLPLIRLTLRYREAGGMGLRLAPARASVPQHEREESAAHDERKGSI